MTRELKRGAARAVADVTSGMLLASIEIKATPERIFRALASEEIAQWWGSPQLYRVTKWVGEVRPGGQWKSSGIGHDGKPFEVGGEFVEVDPPRKLVQTWHPKWVEGPPTTVTYRLEAIEGGTRVTIKHEGFGDNADACRSHTDGWERVSIWLSTWLEAQ